MKITKEAAERLREVLQDLKEIQRPQVIKSIAEAREHGDLKENAEYHAAKDKQGFIEAQIADFESRINSSEVVDISKLSGSNVVFGSTVELEDLDSGDKLTYKIVCEFEADIDNGKISDGSPVARSAIGKSVGDEFEVMVPRGVISYEIISVKFI